MELFGVRARRSGGVFLGSYERLPEGLELVPERWSASIERGYEQASIRATGPLEAMQHLLSWPYMEIEITSPGGAVVWVGRVWEVTARLGSLEATTSLEGLYNQVRVAYDFALGDGSTEPRLTGWATNGRSETRFGARQLILGAGEMAEADANAMRDEVLRRTAGLAYAVASGRGDGVGATLTCYGAYRLLESRYYEMPYGEVAYVDAQSEELPVGSFIENSQIAFGQNAISPGSDDVSSVPGGFTGLLEGDSVTFTGTGNGTLDNGVFVVKSVSSDTQIEIAQFSSANPIPSVAAGALVTVARGGEPYAVRQVAGRLRVHTGAGMVAVRGALRLGRVGTPGANLVVDLMTDSGGSPGAVLTSALLPASAIPLSADWVEFSFAAAVGLAEGGYYWLRLSCATNSLGSYYVAVLNSGDGGLGLEMKYWDGATWRLRGEPYTMPLRVWEMLDSATVLGSVLADAGVAATVTHLSERDVPRKVQDVTTAADYVETLREIGTASKGRWAVYPDVGGGLIFRDVLPPGGNYALRSDGVLVHPAGGVVEPGTLPVGRWVEFPDLPTLDSGMTTEAIVSAPAGVNVLLVEQAEYSASDLRLSMRTEGAVDPWAALLRKRG